MKIEHVGLFVNDLEAVVDFYQKYFHATILERYHNPKTTFTSNFLKFEDEARLEICTREDLNLQQLTDFPTGYMHLAFALGSKDKVNQVTMQLEGYGYQKLSGPRITGNGYYESVVCDPEGNQIELTI